MKKFLIIVSGLILMIILHGCNMSEPAIQYEGEQQPVSRVENILADTIEVENPDLDVKVQLNIQDESN